MKSVKLLILFLIFGLSTSALAQKSYDLNKKTVDFGKIEQWNNDTAWFTFKNTSNKKWFFLPLFYHQEYSVSFNQKAVLPGESARIAVSFYTEKKGNFQLNVPLYISSEMTQINLKVKGNIRSFHPNALVMCPNLDPKGGEDDVLVVIEEKTDTIVHEDVIVVDEENKDKNEDVIVVFIDQDDIPVDTFIIESDSMFVEVIDPVVDTIQIPIDVTPVVVDKTNSNELSDEFAINNIIFLIDVSGSMNYGGKLQHLKESLKVLVKALRPADRISIITYAARAKVAFDPQTQIDTDSVLRFIDSLKANGASYGKEGLNMAYKLAKRSFVENGNNSVILTTDGKFNYKGFSENKLYIKAGKQATKGIRLSTVGFGRDKEALKFLKKLSRFGRGDYILIDNKSYREQILLDLIKKQSRAVKIKNH